ncbi:hypothetical protein RHMOL_Rhmol11G0045400 [Rhododendron molle]|uniref:Uncharacterized protein n=1 Tax=Rhododendron molle TaxID=49168 RepID=A0ACC0LNJ1_RHOML|nr:hypothetical protein RHMOL_Rhmol11G0045400 [Rhododendron molle]
MNTLASCSCHHSWAGSLHTSRFIFKAYLYISGRDSSYSHAYSMCVCNCCSSYSMSTFNHTICPYMTSAASVIALSTSP